MKRVWDWISYKSLYFVNRPLRLQNSLPFSQNRFSKVRSAGLVDIFARAACVSLQSHSPFSSSLQTFPLSARARSRACTCIIYGKAKGKFLHCLIWKQNIQGKQVFSRHRLVTSFTGMGERSIFKSCHRPTIRNVWGIVMLRALFDPIPVVWVSCLHTSCLIDFC